MELSLAKCERDCRFAIPQIYFGETAFLLPIYFNEQKDKSKPAVLCAMTKIKKRKKRNGGRILLQNKNCAYTTDGL